MTQRIALAGCCLTFACALLLSGPHPSTAAAPSSVRLTPIVSAVQNVKTSTVNIHTEKHARQSDTLFSVSKDRKINGMGTGVIVDERGYIVTNYHVVNGVESLRVTLYDGSAYTAEVRSYDRKHDLAIVKINTDRTLDVMPLGTSSDLMLGEDVLAIGNAFGYEHTVTRGIISALSRDVEVNEEQSYENLIQIDAAINPGNSGGPLLNRAGEVIGINVAIRAGAERIGFAIPIDDVRETVRKLLDIERLDNNTHGLRSHDVKRGREWKLVVDAVTPGSPAERAGLKEGDVVVKAGTQDVIDGADFERALLGRPAGETLDVVVQRDGTRQTLPLQLAARNPQQAIPAHQSLERALKQHSVARAQSQHADRAWSLLGLKLSPLAESERGLVGPRYRGGMKVIDVRHESPAAHSGIHKGDILVGLHVWETVNQANVQYVVNHQQLPKFNPLKFYILRSGETLYGYLQVAMGQ